MSINAANPLIRTLANLVAIVEDDPDLTDLMLGVYNDAILYNQELMTPRNAQLFHEQFQRLMGRSVEFVRQKADLAHDREAIEKQRAALQPKKSGATPARRHLVGFLMTPFGDDFKLGREAVRVVVEDILGCELRMASDKTLEDFIRGNVRANMEDADFFVADVTGANPNVMMELGAAYASPRSRPVLLIARVAAGTNKPDLPADLEGHIAVTYAATGPADVAAKVLEKEFRKNVRLEALLKTASKERFISSESLKAWTRSLLRTNAVYDRLSTLYPTVSAWRNAKLEDLEKNLGSEADLAEATLKRIKEHLPE